MILFFSQRPDLLSWFYVYLLDFSLLRNLIHHLALSGFCPYVQKNYYTTSSILNIAVNDLATEFMPCPAHTQKSDIINLIISLFLELVFLIVLNTYLIIYILFFYQIGNEPIFLIYVSVYLSSMVLQKI